MPDARTRKTPQALLPVLLAVGLACLPAAAASQPRTLTGLCLDNLDDGCMDRFIPFNGLSIDFCEETCTLANPVPLRGLDGVLYDMECLADYATDIGGRVLLLQQTDWNGRTRLSFIDREVIRPVVRCP